MYHCLELYLQHQNGARFYEPPDAIKTETFGCLEKTEGKAFILHATDPGSTPDTYSGSCAYSREIPDKQTT